MADGHTRLSHKLDRLAWRVMSSLDDRLAPFEPALLMRRASWFVVVLFGFGRIPIMVLGMVGFGSSRSAVIVTVATACSLLPWVWILLVGLGAVPPRFTRSAFAVVAVVAVVVAFALPSHGLDRPLWSTGFSTVAVSALIVFPNRFGIAVAVAAVLAAPILMTWPDPLLAAGAISQTVGRTLGAYLVVSLVAALRRLAAGRAQVVQQTLLAEQVRIDATLRRTVGDALEDLVHRSQRLLARSDNDPDLADDLHGLVQQSRRCLAAARRTVHAYQSPMAARELHTAMALLRAAGITAQLTAPPGVVAQLEESAFPSFRQQMREILTATPTPRTCTISVTADRAVHLTATNDNHDQARVR